LSKQTLSLIFKVILVLDDEPFLKVIQAASDVDE